MSGAGGDPLLGQLVAGRYRVVSLIGEGGMGRVYRAEQPELDRLVALKILRRDRLARPGPHRERFAREARAASRINHPGLATVYDFGQWEGTLYLAMEYLRGASLAMVIDRRGALPGIPIARILIQVCRALEAIHALQILHRDLKPENIMLVRGPMGEERAKVVDFGLSLALRDDEERLTEKGLVTGTPTYMSPEQCRGRNAQIDPRADIYSLGVVLYEMLCGKVPFAAESASDVLMQHLFKDPVPPSDRMPAGKAAHPALEALCLWALSKDPAARPASAAAMRSELESALELMRQSRAARQAEEAAPLAPAPREAPAPASAAVFEVAVVEPAERPFARSLLALLRANGLAASEAPDLAEALAQADTSPLVLDLGPEPEQTLERLRSALPEGVQPARPLVLVGPDGAIAVMQRALELGAEQYVPETQTNPALLKALRRLKKRARRTAQP